MSRIPGTPLAHNIHALVAEASARVEALTPERAVKELDNPDVLFVDIRDVRELGRQGLIPGAFHAPRGMLEFWIDPESPYCKPALDDGRSLLLYCGGGWRSALAAASLLHMGRDDVRHLDGGFGAWKEQGFPVVEHHRDRSH